MAVANHNIVLWAVPRFHRPVRPAGLDNGRNAAGPGAAARADATGLEEGMFKTVAEGIEENPDGAACLYCCHVWSRAAVC